MPLPAFSNIPLSGINATLLWSMYLNNTQAIGSRTSYTDGTNPQEYYDLANITGVDSNSHGVSTINAAFGTSGTPLLQAYFIRDGNHITTTPAFASEFTYSDQTSTFTGGIGDEMQFDQLQRVNTEWDGGSSPQAGIQLVLPQDTTAINEIYVTKMIEFPSNIVDVFDRAEGGGWTLAWMEIDAIKCGSSTSTNDARFAIIVGRAAGETGLHIRAQIDNASIHPITGVQGTISSIEDGTLPVPYDRSDEGFIVAGQYKLEYWIKRSADRSDLTTGRYVVIMTKMSTGERVVVRNSIGGQYWGYYGFHFTRFFNHLLYTGGFPGSGDITLKFSNLEIWDKAPYILV